MGPAHCASCGTKVAFNPKAFGRHSEQFGRPLSGWYHDDAGAGGRRDHEAAPHDGRSMADEEMRAHAAKNAARAHVEKHLGGQFALLDVQKLFDGTA